MQPGFMIYAEDWLSYTADYSSEEIGEMLKALLGYFLEGKTTEFEDRGMRQFFRQATKGIDLDRSRYHDKCSKNAYNRYRGVCKANKIEPVSFEEWLTTVNDGPQSSTEPTNNQSPIINNQSSIFNSQQSEPMPPTLEEVKQFALENGMKSDPERFFDYYTARGWKIGNEIVSDWKALFRTWEARELPKPPKYAATEENKPPRKIDVDKLDMLKRFCT